MRVDYPLKRETERIGALELRIESLADLNRTIDDLFAELEKSGDTALLEELCPYFGVIWPSARALASALSEQASALQGRTVLEVGCGLALPSLVAARLGARVTATDWHPEVERFLVANARLNSVELKYLRLDWQKDHSRLGQYDWIVGSDILYEKQHPPIVAETLARHLTPGGRILVADPARPYLQAFADEMRSRGFNAETEIRTAHDTPAPKDIFVLSFRRVAHDTLPSPRQ
jgi:predicted nicotinamide N-methyase